MVSRPAFDPNIFARGIRREEWRALLEDPQAPAEQQRHAGHVSAGLDVQDRRWPRPRSRRASINPFTGDPLRRRHLLRQPHLPLLAEGRPRQRRTCTRRWCGRATSSSTKCGQRLGVDAHRRVRAPLRPRRADGHRARARERRASSRHAPGSGSASASRGTPGETLSVAIGQGYVTATPLQMANVSATIANGGTRYRPQFVKRIETPDGTSCSSSSPRS